AEDGIRAFHVTGVQTCALPISRAAMITVHGRGATARDILTLGAELRTTEVAYLAPQASQNTWYPYSFLAPLSQNEPYLSSALARSEERRVGKECRSGGSKYRAY